MMSLPGKLIVIEGIEGCGKSTLAKNVAEKLRAVGRRVVLTKESGGSALGVQLRAILHEQKGVTAQAEYLLFAADRAQHFEEVVVPGLHAGALVISDRMADSSLAYQGYGRGLDVDMITRINRWVMRDIASDLVIYLDISVDEAYARVQSRGHTLTTFEREARPFWEKVKQGYEEIFSTRRDVVRFDARLSAAELADKAYACITGLLHE